MKKIKMNEVDEQSTLKLNTEYYYSEIKRSYGYDIIDMDYNYVFGFGDSEKKKHEEKMEVLSITFIEKVKLYFIQYKMIIEGKYNKFRYHNNNKNC